MTPSDEASPPVVARGTSATPQTRLRIAPRFGLWVLALLTVFSGPLYELVVFSIHSELYSHIVLIPCISVYLVWIKRAALPAPSDPSRRTAAFLIGTGFLVLGIYWMLRLTGFTLAIEDKLALLTASFLLLFTGICSGYIGSATLRALAFPLGFLVFMVPFPVVFTNAIETFFQHTSAAAAHALFSLAGTTLYYHDLVFQLPVITLQVAPECSGIHSSLALFITSVVAGHLFLHTRWKAVLLCLVVIPLAILRNGFRIFTLGELCVHISPNMIDHWIHHRGGPIFFVLSLVPFCFLLRLMYKSDQSAQARSSAVLPK